MLKIVVFDSGYGGEFLADELEENLPIVDITRVIDWRHANDILKSPRWARLRAERALRPYLGKVDLVVFGNYLISATSLKYFEHKYKAQKFVGVDLPLPATFIDQGVLVLATTALTKTHAFRKHIMDLNKTVKVLTPDSWPEKIDDGELTLPEIKWFLRHNLNLQKFYPKEVILASTQFHDIKEEIRNSLGHNIKIYDGFDDAIRKSCKLLGIRGGVGRKK